MSTGEANPQMDAYPQTQDSRPTRVVIYPGVPKDITNMVKYKGGPSSHPLRVTEASEQVYTVVVGKVNIRKTIHTSCERRRN